MPNKCAMVAHFYASIAHLFRILAQIRHLCIRFYEFYHILFFMNKTEIEKKKSLARVLYLSGMEQTEIADKTGVSRVTVSKWCTSEGWKEARAAKNISRPELVNKLLLTIDGLIESVNKSEDPTLIGSLADKLSKLSATIEKLDKKANVIDAIEVFMAFNRWIQDQASYDPEITPELIKAINKYQNKFLMERMQNPSTL
ncbi:hypothetical protein HMPREF1199_00498 [Hoylesella oralis CC98A]|nr:hypothetical protein HMPREF1199_00498 [Hoylesella oralis CC98A]